MLRHSFTDMRHFLCILSTISVFLSFQLDAQITAELAISEGGVSKGSIVLELDHVQAPRATANFIGLATGEFAWIDSTTGAVKHDPYYDGIIFHRVIAGFMNQTGSQKGDGSDGPGYKFTDAGELYNGLDHSVPFVVSMANSGVNTNGSQIFITAAPTTWLDGKHIVFGKAAASSEALVTSINNVPVVDDLPVTEVKIDSVTINYNGVSFDIHAQGLPKVEVPSVAVNHAGVLVELNVMLPASSDTKYTYSFDLKNWQQGYVIYKYDVDDPSSKIDVSSIAMDKDKLFFHASRVTYPVPWPSHFSGRILTLEDSLLADQYDTNWIFTFTSENTGTVTNGADNGSFTIQRFSGDRTGSQEYIQTDLPYVVESISYDLGFVVDIAKYSYSDTEIAGVHSGRIHLVQNGLSYGSEPTNGAMTLTR